MDDRYIESMLREGWDPKPDDGMRDRVLRRAREEASSCKMRRAAFLPRWKLALAGLAAAIILTTSISESKREDRMFEMVCGDGIRGQETMIAFSLSELTLLKQRREIERLLAQAPTDEETYNRKEHASHE